MPGFMINGVGDLPENTREYHRQHRYRIDQLGPINVRGILAKDISLSELNFEKLEILGSALTYKYCKKVNVSDCSINFYSYYTIVEEIKKWQQLVYTSISGIKDHAIYKANSKITLLDGYGKPSLIVTLHNTWPIKVALGELSYTSSDVKTINLTLSCDYLTYEPIEPAAVTYDENGDIANYGIEQIRKDDEKPSTSVVGPGGGTVID